MFHSFHWPLDVKQLTSFMWRKGVYFMPCIDTKYFTLFTNNSLFYPWLKKGMHVVVMEARLAFCPFGCCETCCFPFMTKNDAATIVRCFQIHQHPCCMCIDPSYHHAHCLWLLFFASEEIWPTYYLMTQTERNINPFSPNIHIQILQTDLYTFP